MDKSQAIHSFWSSFDLPAYDELSVPDDAEMPYITYNNSTGMLDMFLALNGSIWYRSTRWDNISRKSDEIAEYLGGGRTIKTDGGYLHLNQGSPFAQRMTDLDPMVRRIYINVSAEFLTAS